MTGQPDDDDPGGADRTVIAQAEPEEKPAPDRTIVETGPAKPGAPRLVEPGTLINNNYRILSLVSAGGMGEVYRAENVFTGDPVAVKVILPGLANDESVLDLFRREARVLVQLRDEAIVRYHNFVLDQGLDRYCLIMEFVDGQHLGKRLNEDAPLPEADITALMRRIGAGLHHAHASGVTHRDLSPDNVILRGDRIHEAVLIDFGIARSTELGDGLAGRFAGKFKYIAPEQLGHAGGEIGPRTDVYGMALLVAAVARGRALDMGDSVVSASAARQAIPDLGGISHRLFPLLQHMLEPDPAKRPRDMGAVLRMLDDPSLIPSRYRLPLWSSEGEAAPAAPAEGVSDSPFASFTPPPAPEAPAAAPAPARRRTGLLVAAALALAALAGAGGWWALRPGAGPEPDPATVVVAPVVTGLAPRDPSTREGFLAEQPLPACTLAERIATGPNAGLIALVSAQGDIDSAALTEGYERAFGTRPSVLVQQVGTAQCAAVDFLREVLGRPAPAPDLQLETRVLADSVQMQGAVSIGSGRNLWLFLIAPTGEVYDLTAQLSQGTAGQSDFGFALSNAGAGAEAAPYILVALESEQPLAQVAAAPSGVAGADILPAVLQELRDAGSAPSVAFRIVDTRPAEASPEPAN